MDARRRRGTWLLLTAAALLLGLAASPISAQGGTHGPAQSATGVWTALDVGANHSCGIRDDGSLWCWGDNTYGQLGDGTTDGPPPVMQLTTDDRARTNSLASFRGKCLSP